MLRHPPSSTRTDPLVPYTTRCRSPGDMFLRNRFPAAMLDGHARFAADRLEAYIDLGRLILPKTRQAPGERQPLARQPVAHRADLPLRDRTSTRLNSSH